MVAGQKAGTNTNIYNIKFNGYVCVSEALVHPTHLHHNRNELEGPIYNHYERREDGGERKPQCFQPGITKLDLV